MSEEKSKKQLLRCSFCGKSEKETHRMIQGPAGVRPMRSPPRTRSAPCSTSM